MLVTRNPNRQRPIFPDEDNLLHNATLPGSHLAYVRDSLVVSCHSCAWSISTIGDKTSWELGWRGNALIWSFAKDLRLSPGVSTTDIARRGHRRLISERPFQLSYPRLSLWFLYLRQQSQIRTGRPREMWGGAIMKPHFPGGLFGEANPKLNFHRRIQERIEEPNLIFQSSSNSYLWPQNPWLK